MKELSFYDDNAKILYRENNSITDTDRETGEIKGEKDQQTDKQRDGQTREGSQAKRDR